MLALPDWRDSDLFVPAFTSFCFFIALLIVPKGARFPFAVCFHGLDPFPLLARSAFVVSRGHSSLSFLFSLPSATWFPSGVTRAVKYVNEFLAPALCTQVTDAHLWCSPVLDPVHGLSN